MATVTAAVGQVERVGKLFSQRFFFNALLPSLIFASSTTLVITETTVGLGSAAKTWSRIDGFNKALAVAGSVAVVWFLAAATASQWRSIVRLFEGYPLVALWQRAQEWPLFGTWFRARPVPGTRQHAAQHRHLGEIGTGALELYYRYPADGNTLLPSRLGNILRAAEHYPYERYQIRAVLFWPRLYPLLPETFQREQEEFVMAYEFPLVVAFQASIFGVLSGGALWMDDSPVWLFLLCTCSAMTVAIAGYRFSLEPATEWAEQFRVAFDLYRGRLLDAWPTVADVRDEREAFHLIEEFVARDEDPAWGAAQNRRAGRQDRPNAADQRTPS